MRRASDHSEGERTGTGRRARDRMLSGQTQTSPVIGSRHELKNLILFLADDLRECALAVGGIESFLVRAQRVLEDPELDVAALRAIVDDRQVGERFDLLSDALGSLRRSMRLIHDSFESHPND
jgi:hypothetical protein